MYFSFSNILLLKSQNTDYKMIIKVIIYDEVYKRKTLTNAAGWGMKNQEHF